MNAPGTPKRTVLCRLSDLVDGASKGFELGDGANRFQLFVVRRSSRVYAYENSCPHTGGPLDWVEDQYLTREKDLILCATHGALFRIETGECLAGPCMGEWLRALKVRVEGDDVVLEL